MSGRYQPRHASGNVLGPWSKTSQAEPRHERPDRFREGLTTFALRVSGEPEDGGEQE